MAKTKGSKKHQRSRSSPTKQMGNVMMLHDEKVQKPRIKKVSWSKYIIIYLYFPSLVLSFSTFLLRNFSDIFLERGIFNFSKL